MSGEQLAVMRPAIHEAIVRLGGDASPYLEKDSRAEDGAFAQLAPAAASGIGQVSLVSTPRETRKPLISTIRWTRIGDGLPPFGVSVAVWIPMLTQVLRAYRDGSMEEDWCWRVSGSEGPRVQAELVGAWAPIPNGVLPPPDGGAA